MKIETNNKVNTNGFSLATELSCTLQEVLQVFPNGRMEGYWDEEKGYDGTDEIGFTTEDGEDFYVYARWGVARVGCRDGWYNPRMEEFKAFVEARTKN